MFQQLPESNSARRPRWGGSVVSTLSHVALITGAVALTARAGEGPIEPPIEHVPFVEVVTPKTLPPTPALSPHSSMPNSVPNAVPQLPTITDIPVGLPPIDLNVAPVPYNDFATRPVGPSGEAHSGALASGGGDGSSPWLAEQVEKAVFLAPGSPTPRYPDLLRAAGVSGAVMVEFIVDTLGRVENGSGVVLATDHEQFSMAVRAVLPRLRFLPAEAQGRKVRQLVRLPFRFDLHS